MKIIGVIGLGSIGMRHAKNLLAMGHKVYGYDPVAARTNALIEAGGRTMPGPFGSLNHLGGEGVVIATPSKQHAHAISVFSTSTIPMFVEKPLATSIDFPLEEDLRFAAESKIQVMVGNNLRFHPCVKQAKEWLVDGKIGWPVWANFVVAQKNEKYKDSVILNWGSHELDLATYLLGPARILAATASAITPGRHDLADIILRHDSAECTSTVHLDYLSLPHQRTFFVQGSGGSFGACLEHRYCGLFDIDGHTAEYHEYTTTWDDDYKEEMQAFVNRIDGKETLGATGQDGLETLKLCLTAMEMAG